MDVAGLSVEGTDLDGVSIKGQLSVTIAAAALAEKDKARGAASKGKEEDSFSSPRIGVELVGGLPVRFKLWRGSSHVSPDCWQLALIDLRPP